MYPVNIFVDARGQWFGASETDQANFSLEKAKRIRTKDGNVCVSAGQWFPSQMQFQPFRDAVEEARKEAEAMQRKGFTWVAHAPICSGVEFTSAIRRENTGGRKPGEKLSLGLYLWAVKGYSKSEAARRVEMNRRDFRRACQAFFKFLGNRQKHQLLWI